MLKALAGVQLILPAHHAHPVLLLNPASVVVVMPQRFRAACRCALLGAFTATAWQLLTSRLQPLALNASLPAPTHTTAWFLHTTASSDVGTASLAFFIVSSSTSGDGSLWSNSSLGPFLQSCMAGLVPSWPTLAQLLCVWTEIFFPFVRQLFTGAGLPENISYQPCSLSSFACKSPDNSS